LVGVDRLTTPLNSLDDAVPVDHKSCPPSEPDDGHQHPILARNGAAVVTQYGVSQPERLRERLIPGRLIHTDTQHLSPLILEPGDISLIRLQFFRSTTREGFNVKGQNHCLAPLIVAEPYHPAILIGQAEVRRVIADLKLTGTAHATPKDNETANPTIISPAPRLCRIIARLCD